MLPQETSLMVQGNRVHGCYHPLPKRQLEWQISINDVRKQVEKEQAEIMQARLSLYHINQTQLISTPAHVFLVILTVFCTGS